MSGPSTIDYAHTPQAHRQRETKARVLARWCYDHGIGAQIQHCPADIRRRAARRAQVAPPQEPPGCLGETWRLVLRLLEQRERWDRTHDVRPPAQVECVVCEILGGDCGHRNRASSACSVCGGQLHPTLIVAGEPTHPSCHPDSAGPTAPGDDT